MPDVTTAVPEGAGPNASVPEGMAQQFAANSHAIKSVGAPPGGGAPSGSAPAGGPPQTQPSQGPAMPPPREPFTAQDMQPGGRVFGQPGVQPNRPWKEEMRVWAAHPNAGPVIGFLNARANPQSGQRS